VAGHHIGQTTHPAKGRQKDGLSNSCDQYFQERLNKNHIALSGKKIDFSTQSFSTMTVARLATTKAKSLMKLNISHPLWLQLYEMVHFFSISIFSFFLGC
jgi:hypothetical protein